MNTLYSYLKIFTFIGNRKSLLKSFGLLFAACSILTWNPAAFCEDAIKPGSLIERLREARRAGDTETVRELEAMRPKNPAGGESAGPTVLIPSDTHGCAGDPTLVSGDPNHKNLFGPPLARFGDDVKVRPWNEDTKEWNQTMASDSGGNLYVAWQDDSLPFDYIQVYKSFDEGETWFDFGAVINFGAHLKEPSLAVGEGAGGDVLLLAYILDDGILPRPEVATSPLIAPGWAIHHVPVWPGWDGYAKPAVNTDAIHFGVWYAYLTCEGIFDAFADNINVCSWRSLDSGASWIDEQVVLGNTDPDPWRDADGSYGTAMNRVFLVTYNDNDNALYVVTSDDYAVTWNPVIMLFVFPFDPLNAVDPEIAAAVSHDNVMVCFTMQSLLGDDNIGYLFSVDGGDVWTPIIEMTGSTDEHEWAVSLTANEGGEDWHLAYTSHYTQQNRVFYTRCPQDLTDLWLTPVIVDDLGSASGDYSKKGIASNPLNNSACMAWADYRDGSPDYDCYSDHIDNLGLMLDNPEIIAFDGGSCNFTLSAGAANAGRIYRVVGSVSGYDPGIMIGGALHLPVNFDFFTIFTINLANTPIFTDFWMPLDPVGNGTATLNIFPFFLGVPITMHFAYFLEGPPWDFASNAVRLDLLP